MENRTGSQLGSSVVWCYNCDVVFRRGEFRSKERPPSLKRGDRRKKSAQVGTLCSRPERERERERGVN